MYGIIHFQLMIKNMKLYPLTISQANFSQLKKMNLSPPVRRMLALHVWAFEYLCAKPKKNVYSEGKKLAFRKFEFGGNILSLEKVVEFCTWNTVNVLQGIGFFDNSW